MELSKIDPAKLSDMVMCGDHPSVTKTELNVKDERCDDKTDKGKPNDLSLMSYAKISPTSSRTERVERGERGERDERLERGGRARSADKSRHLSEHALRAAAARRHARPLDVVSRHDDVVAPGNKAMVQAALGSVCWPPYLVCVWVCVLLLTHALHCLAAALRAALPPLRSWAEYFCAWTARAWRDEERGAAAALALLAAALHAAHWALAALLAAALWALEPVATVSALTTLTTLTANDDDKETRVVNYLDDFQINTHLSLNK